MADKPTQPDPLEELYEENRPGSMSRVDKPLKQIAAAIAILRGEDTRVTSGTRTGDVYNKSGKRVSAKYSMHKADETGLSHAIDLGLDNVPLEGKKARENFVANVARVLGYKNIFVDEHKGTGEHIHVQTGPKNLHDPTSSGHVMATVRNAKGRKSLQRVERTQADAEAQLLQDLAKIHGTTVDKIKPLLAKMISEDNIERNNVIGDAVDHLGENFQGFISKVGVSLKSDPKKDDVKVAAGATAPAEGDTKTAEQEPGFIGSIEKRITALFGRNAAPVKTAEKIPLPAARPAAANAVTVNKLPNPNAVVTTVSEKAEATKPPVTLADAANRKKAAGPVRVASTDNKSVPSIEPARPDAAAARAAKPKETRVASGAAAETGNRFGHLKREDIEKLSAFSKSIKRHKSRRYTRNETREMQAKLYAAVHIETGRGDKKGKFDGIVGRKTKHAIREFEKRKTQLLADLSGSRPKA